jgi:pimeloyl-ACP methyl ester carboxylesterase
MSFERCDYRVRTRDGVALRARQVVAAGRECSDAIVFVHGIAAPLEPTYDLGLPGYSFLEEIASRGYRAIAFDHRNFGQSDRCSAMAQEPAADPEGVGMQTLDDSVEDIRAVVVDTRERYRVERVTVFGSSRGAIQVLCYAAGSADGLSMAILNNPSSLCYLAGVTDGPMLEALRVERAKAARPHNYTIYTEEYQRNRWRHLFGDNPSVDELLQRTYLAACIQSDAQGARHSPAMFRVPTESFPPRVPLIDLRRLRVPTLVIEAEDIPTEHIAAFRATAPAGLARVVRIRDSNHFTLRNPRRFELANLIDVAVAAHRWGNQARLSG